MIQANKWLLGTILSGSALVGGAVMWEGTKYDPYYDIVGVLTVCNGYTGADIKKNKRYTKAECDAYLYKELYVHATGMLNCVKVPLNQHQFDAFTLFTYNVGVGAFCKSKGVLENLNKGNYAQACKGLLQWVYAGRPPVRVQGLANRRDFEYKMCMGALNVETRADLRGHWSERLGGAYAIGPKRYREYEDSDYGNV